ncbi:MAG TPA: hypothetical protein VEX11_11965, partial [Acetobacteraceae bacterium]|nr:hypothetical protein [Acetobacteraceae bacterium]
MLRPRSASVLPSIAALPVLLAVGAAGAQTAVSPGSEAAAVELPEATLPELVVQARRAEAARQGILARFGAREYQVERSTIEALPGGANQPLN